MYHEWIVKSSEYLKASGSLEWFMFLAMMMAVTCFSTIKEKAGDYMQLVHYGGMQ